MAPGAGRRPAGADWLQAAAVAAGLFALYAATSPRSVALEDDGLFVLSSYFFGIDHPPGFPLFTIVGKLFTLLPAGSVAYRVHLVSAFFGALTCGFLWILVRQMVEGRWPAYVAAFGLGLSRTFWSQSIIAEVYTFNTFFLFAVLLLILRATVPGRSGRSGLIALALVFGLSLANHWPLMLLTAPGLAVLLWPRWRDILRSAGPVIAAFMLGLTPYAWMVVHSRNPLLISFYGPLEDWKEALFMLTRAGYATADVSQTATWFDRTRFFAFFGSELLMQFAVLGTLFAAAGFAVQWKVWRRATCWGLTLAFLGPSALLLCLLGFDYDAVHKHIFHVYPLPAYGIAAIWMALGGAWLADRARASEAVAGLGYLVLGCLIFATGWHWNTRSGIEWTERYARALLEAVPRNAILIVRGDSDLAPLAYFHMIEGWRPDLTLVQPSGLILGNRLLHPLRVSEEAMKEYVIQRVKAEKGTVASTLFSEMYLGDLPRRDAWLFQVVDRTPGSPRKVIDIPEPLVRFFDNDVLRAQAVQPWLANLQGELRQRYARLLAMQLLPGAAPDARVAAQLQALSQDFHGALGLVEGFLSSEHGYDSRQAVALLDQVRLRMPQDAAKDQEARYFELRAYLRQAQKDMRGAVQDLETSVALFPVKENGAVAALIDQYTKTGNDAALASLRARLKP